MEVGPHFVKVHYYPGSYPRWVISEVRTYCLLDGMVRGWGGGAASKL